MAISVPHEDLENPSLTISIRDNKLSARRVIRVSNDDVTQAITDLGGTVVSAGGIVIRVDPDTFPGLGHVYISRIRNISLDEYLNLGCVGPLNEDGLAIDPNGYRVLILDYETETFERGSGPASPTGPYLTITRTTSKELAQIGKDGLTWEFHRNKGPGSVDRSFFAVKEIKSSFSAMISHLNIRMTWHKVVNPDFDTIEALTGTVSEDPIFDKPGDQVLFEGLQDRRRFNLDGSLEWELDYQFDVRTVRWRNPAQDDPTASDYLLEGGWNHFPRADHATQDEVDNLLAQDGAQQPWQRTLFTSPELEFDNNPTSAWQTQRHPIIPQVQWLPDLFAVAE